MTLVAHVSDLHFGAEDPDICEALVEALHAAAPEAVVVSGDLTQRARTEQFRAAAAFLRRLPAPQLVVPGNHDVPARNLLARFLSPLDAYRREICDDLAPELRLGEVTILGLNTTRSNVIKGGRINEHQMRLIRERFAAAPAALHMLVTHHPFGPLPPGRGHVPGGRERRALRAAAQAGVEVVLAGHLHHAFAADASSRHPEIDNAVLTIQAGCAVSHRRRDTPNAFNLIHATPGRVAVEVREWTSRAGFQTARREAWLHAGHRWQRA